MDLKNGKENEKRVDSLLARVRQSSRSAWIVGVALGALWLSGYFAGYYAGHAWHWLVNLS